MSDAATQPQLDFISSLRVSAVDAELASYGIIFPGIVATKGEASQRIDFLKDGRVPLNERTLAIAEDFIAALDADGVPYGRANGTYAEFFTGKLSTGRRLPSGRDSREKWVKEVIYHGAQERERHLDGGTPAPSVVAAFEAWAAK